MQWFLYVIGALWIALGACLILYTGKSRNTMKTMVQTVNELFLIFVNIVIGVLLIIAAFYSHKTWFILLLGVLTVAEGTLYLVNPSNVYQKVRDWYLNKASDQTYRLFGIILLIIGTAVMSWV